MTAEIAILNRNAVVLATDSAITSMVTSTSHGRVPKISHNANKLFALSTSDPLAVMIYNGSAFGPVPWETIIKDFRRNARSHSTVEEHAQQFIDHLEDFKDYISEARSDEIVTEARDKELDGLREALDEAQATHPSDEWDSAAVQEFISDHCQHRIDQIRSTSDQADLDEDKLRGAVEATVSDWNEHVRSKLSLLIDNRVSEDLMRLVVEALRVVPLSESHTGIVVAGFGKDQYFPALSHYIVDSVLGGEIKVYLKQSILVGASSAGHVVPFAQQALPIAFLGGLPPDYHKAIHSSLGHVVELIFGYLLDELGGSLTEERKAWMHSEKDRLHDDFLRYFQYRLRQDIDIKDTGDISAMVAYLSKEDIAELAEALVHLTQLKLKVSPEPETVGGPIDVAVISKGDGLIWIKRKHYFERELNPRYFHRMSQEVDDWRAHANKSEEDGAGSVGDCSID